MTALSRVADKEIKIYTFPDSQQKLVGGILGMQDFRLQDIQNSIRDVENEALQNISDDGGSVYEKRGRKIKSHFNLIPRTNDDN